MADAYSGPPPYRIDIFLPETRVLDDVDKDEGEDKVDKDKVDDGQRRR